MREQETAFARARGLREADQEPSVDNATFEAYVQSLAEAGLDDLRRAQIPAKQAAGEAALELMDDHLSRSPFFVGDRLTLADITLYPYTHVADDGGFELGRYPAIGAWLARVEAEPHHIAMKA